MHLAQTNPQDGGEEPAKKKKQKKGKGGKAGESEETKVMSTDELVAEVGRLREKLEKAEAEHEKAKQNDS